MRELSLLELHDISGGFRIKLHFNIVQAVFTVIGAGILGGPVGAGVALAGVIGAQGTGNLVDLMGSDPSGSDPTSGNQP